MMPLSLVEKIWCILLVLAIAGALGQAFVDFVTPMSSTSQREAMQPTLELYQRLGLAGGGR